MSLVKGCPTFFKLTLESRRHVAYNKDSPTIKQEPELNFKQLRDSGLQKQLFARQQRWEIGKLYQSERITISGSLLRMPEILSTLIHSPQTR